MNNEQRPKKKVYIISRIRVSKIMCFVSYSFLLIFWFPFVKIKFLKQTSQCVLRSFEKLRLETLCAL